MSAEQSARPCTSSEAVWAAGRGRSIPAMYRATEETNAPERPPQNRIRDLGPVWLTAVVALVLCAGGLRVGFALDPQRPQEPDSIGYGRIAKNLYRRYVEKERVETRARERLGVEVRAYDDFERVEERTYAEHVAPQLALALAALPAGQREAVQLHVVDELPYAAVATRLGVSELAVRLRVMRGLKRLARAVGGAAGE